MPPGASVGHLTTTMALQVGDKAPDFELAGTGGTNVRLSDYSGKKNVVLYFYPRDFTPVCTKETCGFQNLYETLRSQDTEIIGISVDPVDSHEKFAKKYRVAFPLLSDPNRTIAALYGATNAIRSFLGNSARITFVIDKLGIVREIIRGELSAQKHIVGVTDTLRTMAG